MAGRVEVRGEQTEGGTRRILAVLGTRPEAIKLAPVIGEARRRAGLRVRLCLTAQHRELVDGPLALFGLTADHDLDLMRPDQGVLEFAGRALPALDRVLAQERPDLVLVQGDTTTAFAGAFAAHHHRVAVGHVEAGLRTGRRYAPFPEEMNRRLVARLARWHFAPTESARQNLLAEGVPAAEVVVTGNPVVDAVQEILARTGPGPPPPVAPGQRLVLCTIHRREHFGPVLDGLFVALRELAEQVKDADFVLPVHPNPTVQQAARRLLEGHPRVRLVEPQPYATFLRWLADACLVLTDSGGVQEEAPCFGVPTLVLREATERTEGVAAGHALLVGTDPADVRREALAVLRRDAADAGISDAGNPYGDGQASARILDVLEPWLKGGGEDG